MDSGNPYWDAVRDSVRPGHFPGDPPCVGRWECDRKDGDPPVLHRDDYVSTYAWTITDPISLWYVATLSRDRLVDPMAGTGYWAYLLGQMGVDCVCYDLRPGKNSWHKDKPLWVDVAESDGAEAVQKHPGRTLLLSWPPYNEDAGSRILAAYQGDRVIYIGEGRDGCTGDSTMHDALTRDWRRISTHTPIQWDGLRDTITMYQRRENTDVA